MHFSNTCLCLLYNDQGNSFVWSKKQMATIFCKVEYSSPFFFGDTREFGFGFACELFEDILDFS